MQTYPVIKHELQIEIEVKRSRFITFAKRIRGNDQAKKVLHVLRDQYPDANHHCYAFVSGAPNFSQGYGYSDDGEPNGTAGKPIFSRVHHSGIGELILVVVRYFGGTKLGTGGLARAYGDAASKVMSLVETTDYVAQKTVSITIPYHRESYVRHQVGNLKGHIIRADYQDQVTLNVSIPHNTNLPDFSS